MKTSLFQVLASPLSALKNQNHSTLSEFKNNLLSAYKPLTKAFDTILSLSAIYILLSIDGSLVSLFGQANIDASSSIIETTMLLSLISAFFVQYRLAFLYKTTTSLLSEKSHQQNSSFAPEAQANWHNQIAQVSNASAQDKSRARL